MTSDPQICALADAYGGIAVLAFNEVLALAKLGGAGTVDIRYSVLARRAFLDTPEHAKVVLGGMANLCLIDLGASPMHGADGTMVTLGEWESWQFGNPVAADPTSAERTRRWRERKRQKERRGTQLHVVSDDPHVTTGDGDRDGPKSPESVPENGPVTAPGDAKVPPTGTDTDNSKKESSKDVTLRAIPGGGDQDG